MAIKALPLESQPEVKLGIGVASTVLPGASPETVEDLVTKKLEKEIGKVKGIDKMTSVSKNSVSLITVQFKPEEDITEAIRNLKDRVDFAKKDLPSDAKDPVVQEINISDTPFWTFTIGGKYDGFALRSYAQSIKDELEKIDQVSEARISGGDEEEFHVNYDPIKLETY
jgi:multidrug efflux pump subunit AcrB